MQSRCVTLAFPTTIAHALDLMCKLVPRRSTTAISDACDSEAGFNERYTIESCKRKSELLVARWVASGLDVRLEHERFVRTSNCKLSNTHGLATKRTRAQCRQLATKSRCPPGQAGLVSFLSL